jgi:hypothetical protein
MAAVPLPRLHPPDRRPAVRLTCILRPDFGLHADPRIGTGGEEEHAVETL